mmetsp:Transcript_18069/g.30088  ORF Transcript_18069/g.30088 Transcript_18069/m.30088 type:complete len:81 (+) Transcript_18069:183-425(+)
MNFPKVIGLNVGGSVFLTSLATLSQSNFLGSMFSGRFSPESLEKDRDGNYFIDRDGTHVCDMAWSLISLLYLLIGMHGVV